MDKPEPPSPSSQQEPPRQTGPWVQYARYSHLAFVLPAATFAGWLLGGLVDRWLGTTWIRIAGLLLGAVAGVVEMIRAITVWTRKDQREP